MCSGGGRSQEGICAYKLKSPIHEGFLHSLGRFSKVGGTGRAYSQLCRVPVLHSLLSGAAHRGSGAAPRLTISGFYTPVTGGDFSC